MNNILHLYSLAQELARDLVFEVDGEVVTLSIKGVLIAKISSTSYNFSFFEVSEDEFILALQASGYIVYLGIESDSEIDEEAYSSIGRILISELMPYVNVLISKAKEVNYSGADILLDDDMSPTLKEAMYEILMKHRKGKSPYEQFEIA
ncbi:hypothetical protein [Pyrococcus abyssi]|uniref:Uncharacterized protein n=1 Tax=Pyrococcus abyssi (strain GE5 / Orsay) TaxID=272844 RepID=Q9V0U2_PYRAB|nr:hypothetical protein [Pyrococcus abyssi]CAB49611.1 Hypothetical protein PAB1904 [Pyrococcus abyssi GE5]CCE70088.1 TPA: hypothetical protein PAB1904 [Pyrococcus abyssi GE5]